MTILKKIFLSPLRVYLLLSALALIGIYTGFQLPVSLYPNSGKPRVQIGIPYGPLEASEFLNTYGKQLESELTALGQGKLKIEKLTSEYNSSELHITLNFDWGVNPVEATKEVKSILNSLSARWPRESREGFWTWGGDRSGGFIGITFYSEKRGPNDLYEILEPLFSPYFDKIADAKQLSLWNPAREEIRIELNLESMTALGLLPSDIEDGLYKALQGFKGGRLKGGKSRLMIETPRALGSLKDVENLKILTRTGSLVPLSQLAKIQQVVDQERNTIVKVNGIKTLFLYGAPKQGGNVKQMAEDVLQMVKDLEENFPPDVQYKVLVDPSEFIRGSIKNVIKEVLLASGLAVLILFLFVGNLKNTITAAIEIPMSMVLALILMKMTGMNINLISLGGLALSAGMNVDASVVVMENIFRHFDQTNGPLNYEQMIKKVLTAVREVILPIFASTVSSLVVFLPLAFTNDLTNAILGDLAKAVIFSHGASFLVALVLVPTIRLHLMKNNRAEIRSGASPIDGLIKWIEKIYGLLLGKFLSSTTAKLIVFLGSIATLVSLLIFVLPTLEKEIIGTPDTDFLITRVTAQGLTHKAQLDDNMSELDAKFREQFHEDIKFTFMQVWSPTNGMIMAKLRDKSKMKEVWKKMEEFFVNTPENFFWVGPWNPSELPIPDPPHLKLVVRGGQREDRIKVSSELFELFQSHEVFKKQWSEPALDVSDRIIMRPHLNRWPLLQKAGLPYSPSQISDYSRVLTEGKPLGRINLHDQDYNIFMGLPPMTLNYLEDLQAIPIRLGEKVLPLKALASIQRVKGTPHIYREDGRELFLILGKQQHGEKESDKQLALQKAETLLQDFKANSLPNLKLDKKPFIYIEDAQKDLNNALSELSWAIAISIGLILFTLIFQFGGLIESLIILSAIPTGLMGVLIGLKVFGSTLSLNSALGVVLLNGIAVANSIILVDFTKHLIAQGLPPVQAVQKAAIRRLRPILITSLTTILGMLPIALGLGEGGKILAPLGISVSGGLWCSTLFTLFIVPALHHMYLNRQQRLSIQKQSYLTNSSTLINQQG